MEKRLPIERIARRIHARREFERTHCRNDECQKPITGGPGYCSEQCLWDDQAART